MHAVYLLQQHHKRQLVLHGVLTQAEHMVTGGTQRGGMTICRADKEGHMLHRLQLPLAHLAFKLAGCPILAALIHGNTQAALAGLQQAGRD